MKKKPRWGRIFFLLLIVTAAIGLPIHLLSNSKQTSTSMADAKSSQKIIMLDPGHGGPDQGATGNGLYEDQINWAFGKQVAFELKKRGYKVILSHSSPSTTCLAPSATYSQVAELKCRLTKASMSHADLYLSIHANAMPNAAESYVHGIEVHYNATGSSDYPQTNPFPKKSKRLAELLNQEVVPAMQEQDLGVKDDQLYVTRMAKMPSVLIEMGYLTNLDDAAKLNRLYYQKQAAGAIGKAIDLYFKNAPTDGSTQ